MRVGTVTRTDTAVSLTGQLTGGELGRWCAATLTGTARLADDVAAAATNLHPIRPCCCGTSPTRPGRAGWATR